MPIYTYECPSHGEFDAIMQISEMAPTFLCPQCKHHAKKIISNGKGGVRRSDSEWIRGVGQFMERPINTIQELRKFYKENPNIRPYESHPGLPSSLGDIKKVPTREENFKVMQKEARELIWKRRAITINSRKSAEATPV